MEEERVPYQLLAVRDTGFKRRKPAHSMFRIEYYSLQGKKLVNSVFATDELDAYREGVKYLAALKKQSEASLRRRAARNAGN
jgi:hypothetical protein